MSNDDIEVVGEDSPALRRAIDTAMTIISSTADVEGALVLVISNDQDAGSGTSVSMQMRGLLPDDAMLMRIIKALLTSKVERRESP